MSASQPRPIRKGSRFGKWKVIQAGLRNKRGESAALVTCLGWTVIGSIVARAMACRSRPAQTANLG